MKLLQRRIGILFASIGLFVSITNLISLTIVHNFIYAITDYRVFTLFGWTAIFTLSIFLHQTLSKWIHTLLPLFIGSIAVFDDYESIYGLGLFLLGLIIAVKYKMLSSHTILKFTIFLIYVFSMIIFAAQINDSEHAVVKGIDAILYLLLMGISLYSIYADEIRKHVANSRRQTEYIKRLKKDQEIEAREMAEKMNELKQEVDGLRKAVEPFDLSSRDITPAEERVLEALVKYGGSNVELSERLGISRSTVKAHLASIFDKLGVDTRWAVIDLCRYNTWGRISAESHSSAG